MRSFTQFHRRFHHFGAEAQSCELQLADDRLALRRDANALTPDWPRRAVAQHGGVFVRSAMTLNRNYERLARSDRPELLFGARLRSSHLINRTQ